MNTRTILPLLAVFLCLSFCLSSCGKAETVIDYESVSDFEAALNAGEDLTGKVVKIEVLELIPDSAFGYNMTAGEHLNFCSTSNPGVKAEDTVIVQVKEVQSILGSWIISYEKIG